MNMRAMIAMSGFVALTTGCSDDGISPAAGAESTSGGEVTSTVPLTTTVSPDPTAVTFDGTDDGEDSGGTTVSLDGGSSGTGEIMGTTSDGTTTNAAGDSSDSGSGTSTQDAVVEWCILQFPAEIMAAPDAATFVYARLYVEGITDQTEFVDEDALVVAQFGYGDDDSMPDDGWTWTMGEPNPGWDGTMAKGGFGNENNDEYQAELLFPVAGTYDYAARFSADGGTTWVYCDLDDLQTGGYTPDQAGNAVIE